MVYSLCKKGFVTVSMSYRLVDILDPFFLADIGNGFKKGVVRAVHDTKGTIRFLRKTVEEQGNPFRIDPNIIRRTP